MGGRRSTRWNGTVTRTETDPLLQLDIAQLKHGGALEPGAAIAYTWSSRGQVTGQLLSVMQTGRLVLTLYYRYRRWNQDAWTSVEDDIEVDTTPCNFGGSRPWLVCPKCRSRRGVLFCLDGYFRCRTCHNLAYSSTREDLLTRRVRRCRELQHQLQGRGYDHPIWEIPDRPQGMSRFRYETLVRRLVSEFVSLV